MKKLGNLLQIYILENLVLFFFVIVFVNIRLLYLLNISKTLPKFSVWYAIPKSYSEVGNLIFVYILLILAYYIGWYYVLWVILGSLLINTISFLIGKYKVCKKFK